MVTKVCLNICADILALKLGCFDKTNLLNKLKLFLIVLAVQFRFNPFIIAGLISLNSLFFEEIILKGLGLLFLAVLIIVSKLLALKSSQFIYSHSLTLIPVVSITLKMISNL